MGQSYPTALATLGQVPIQIVIQPIHSQRLVRTLEVTKLYQLDELMSLGSIYFQARLPLEMKQHAIRLCPRLFGDRYQVSQGELKLYGLVVEEEDALVGEHDVAPPPDALLAPYCGGELDCLVLSQQLLNPVLSLV